MMGSVTDRRATFVGDQLVYPFGFCERLRNIWKGQNGDHRARVATMPCYLTTMV
jgi:hypothetical protein